MNWMLFIPLRIKAGIVFSRRPLNDIVPFSLFSTISNLPTLDLIKGLYGSIPIRRNWSN
jgi:hypothetical protein